MMDFERPVTSAIQNMIYALLVSEFPQMPVHEAIPAIIVCIRVHPSVYLTLLKEMGEFMTVKDNRPYLYDILVVKDPDVWISLEKRSRIGWP